MEPKRLNKYISDAGFCSRREADRLIEEGRVTVNGKTPEPGTKVMPQDKVRIDDEMLQVREEEIVFLLFNKPAGIAATTDLSVRNNIISALNYPASLLPIGHLEREAEGLILLSNDTELARKMTKADTKYEKEYIVTVDKPITGDFLSRISEGSAPATSATSTSRKKHFVAKEGANRFRIGLLPGTNHHLKRMCEALGYEAVHLQRIKFGSLTPAKLQVGHWRTLTAAEVDSLKGVLTGRTRKSNAAPQVNTEDFEEAILPARSRSVKSRNVADKPARSRTTAGNRSQNSRGSRNAAPKAVLGKKAAPRGGGRSNSSPKRAAKK